MAAPALPEILCVDDEPRLLEGFALTLRRHFRVTTAPGGAEALALIKARAAPFPVVMSDMRMPGMDGAALLATVRTASPDSVRLLLTGYADMQSAIAAVNEGQIFRFLTKPCPADQLVSSLQAAVEQHRLLVSERELLEKTLHGSIRALIDVLAASNPRAFGRATRLKRAAGRLAQAAGVKDIWAVEIAALLSQIGYVILPPKTMERLFARQPLDAEETAMVEKVPSVARQVVKEIPRLEAVGEILDNVARPFVGRAGEPAGEALPFGARILRLVQDYDQLEAEGRSPHEIFESLSRRAGIYDPRLLERLGSMPTVSEGVSVARTLSELCAGMVLAADVTTGTGMLLLAHGQELTESSLQRLRNFTKTAGVREPIYIVSEGAVPARSVV